LCQSKLPLAVSSARRARAPEALEKIF
jgi:hypothetical protein